MNKQLGFRTLIWLPCAGLLALTLTACSTSDSPLAPTIGSQSDLEAPVQRWEPPVIDDGKGDGGTLSDQEIDNRDGYMPPATDPGGKTPSSPDGGLQG